MHHLPTLHHERRATWVLFSLVAFLVAAPILVGLLQDGLLTTAFVPLLVWGWLLWFYGWSYMRRATCLLTGARTPTNTQAGQAFLANRAAAHFPYGSTVQFTVQVARMHAYDRPRPTLSGQLSCNGTTIALDAWECLALANALTDNGSHYDLALIAPLSGTITPADTRHAYMARVAAGSAACAEARATVAQTPPKPGLDGWLTRRLPGKMRHFIQPL